MLMKNFPRERDLSNSHGAIGKIIKIELPTLVLADRDGVEKVILIKDTTIIMHFRDTIKATDLKVNDVAVIIGSPNTDGQIEAIFIRVLPQGSPMSFGISHHIN